MDGEMHIPEWRRSTHMTTSPGSMRNEFQLQLRKKLIDQKVASKRRVSPIYGMNLNICRRWGKRRKRCYLCGSEKHLKRDCPLFIMETLLDEIKQLKKTVQKLNCFSKKRENKNTKRRRKKKEAKREEKKKEEAKAQNTAVKIKRLLFKDEATEGLAGGGKFWIAASRHLERLTQPQQKKVKKEYKKLFGKDLLEELMVPIYVDEWMGDKIDIDED